MMRQANNFCIALVNVVTACVLLAGCVNDDKVPTNTIPQDKMATILSEIHLAESRVNRLQLKSLDSSLLVFNKLKQEIWEKYKVDTTVYRNSYSYYMTHPKQMAQIYEKVNKKIEDREKSKNIKM